jgi:hypothetical protein
MKISKAQLKEMIRELYTEILDEDYFSDITQGKKPKKPSEYSNKKEKCPKGQRRDPSTGRCTPVGNY